MKSSFYFRFAVVLSLLTSSTGCAIAQKGQPVYDQAISYDEISRYHGDYWFGYGPAIITSCQRISLMDFKNHKTYELTAQDPNFYIARNWLSKRFNDIAERSPLKVTKNSELRNKLVIYASNEGADTGRVVPDQLLLSMDIIPTFFGPNNQSYPHLLNLMSAHSLNTCAPFPREEVVADASIDKFSKPNGDDWFHYGPAIITSCKRICLRDHGHTGPKKAFELTAKDANFSIVRNLLFNKFRPLLNRMDDPPTYLGAREVDLRVTLFASDEINAAAKNDWEQELFSVEIWPLFFGPNNLEYTQLLWLMQAHRVPY